jgi:hypothetical protein
MIVKKTKQPTHRVYAVRKTNQSQTEPFCQLISKLHNAYLCPVKANVP